MAEEIAEAVQIIRVAFDGMEIALKIGSGGVKAMKEIVDVLIGLMEYEKSIGKVNMRKLLTKGGDLQVFQFNESDLKKVEKLAKKYGILYSVLPNIDKENGKREIVFHTEAVPRVNLMIEKLKTGRIATFEEYLKEDGGKNIKGITEFLQKEKQKGNLTNRTEDKDVVDAALDSLLEKVGSYAVEQESISADAVKDNFSVSQEEAEKVIGRLENIGVIDRIDKSGKHKVLMDKDAYMNRIKSYRTLADRIKAVSRSKDVSLVDITISKNLIVEENENAIKTRVPGTWGDNARFLWISKENAMEIHNGKTILTFLEKDKDYKLYDADNRIAEKKKGEALYGSNYDAVEIGVRQRYEKMVRDRERKEKQIEEALKNLTGEDRKNAEKLKKASDIATKKHSGKAKKR